METAQQCCCVGGRFSCIGPWSGNDTSRAASYYLGGFIVPPCGSNCKGHFPPFSKSVNTSPAALRAARRFQRGGVAAARAPEPNNKGHPSRGGLSPSLTAVVRASGGDVPVARSRSAVRALATPWRGSNKADPPGAGLPCSSGAGYAGRHPERSEGWRHHLLCSSRVFGGFLSRRENITPKGLR